MPEDESHEPAPQAAAAGPGGPRIADSARLALPSEASQIGDLQRRAWRADLADDLAESLLAVPARHVDEVWQQAITRPPLAQHRVLVAVDGGTDRIAGFATTGPSEDPDAEAPVHGEVGEFVVDPVARGHGHGSRLLHAVVDTMVADGYEIARIWIRSVDDPLRRFLIDAGWAPDGAHRELGSEHSPARIKQVRLHTAIA